MTPLSFVHAARFVILSFFLCFAVPYPISAIFRSDTVQIDGMVCVRARVCMCELEISPKRKVIDEKNSFTSFLIEVNSEVRNFTLFGGDTLEMILLFDNSAYSYL